MSAPAATLISNLAYVTALLLSHVVDTPYELTIREMFTARLAELTAAEIIAQLEALERLPGPDREEGGLLTDLLVSPLPSSLSRLSFIRLVDLDELYIHARDILLCEYLVEHYWGELSVFDIEERLCPDPEEGISELDAHKLELLQERRAREEAHNDEPVELDSP
jgi:hypothetical protein